MPKPTSTLGVKLFLLVLVPCLALLIIAGVGVRGSLGRRSAANELDSSLEGAARAVAVVHALQVERTYSAAAASDPALVARELTAAREATDRAATALADAPLESWRIVALQLDDLVPTRAAVDAAEIERSQVLDDYTDAIVVLIVRIGEIADVAPDARSAQRAVALDASVRLTDVVALQRALLLGAAAADDWSPFVDQRLNELDGAVAELLAVYSATGAPADVRGLDGVLSSAVGADRFLAREQAQAPDVDPMQAVGVTDELIGDLRAVDATTVATARDAASAVSASAWRGLALDAALAMAAMAFAVAAWFSIDRLASRRLFGLARDIDDIAHDHLPAVIQRAVAEPDSDVVLEPVAERHSSELDALVRSVNDLQLAAAGASIEALSARTASDATLVGLGQRNRQLAERQLRLLGELDDAPDDQRTGVLRRLRASARRLRREADGLLVAGGADLPTKRLGNAVAVADAVRRAAGTIDAPEHVEVRSLEPGFIRGDVAADAILVIAQLVDLLTGSGNIASATVSGRAEPGGYVLAVLGHGAPFDPDDLTFANRVLHDAELATDDIEWFGLAVAGRLARRHGLDIEVVAGQHGPLAKVVLGPHHVNVGRGSEAVTEWSRDLHPPAAERPAERPDQLAARAATAPTGAALHAPSVPHRPAAPTTALGAPGAGTPELARRPAGRDRAQPRSAGGDAPRGGQDRARGRRPPPGPGAGATGGAGPAPAATGGDRPAAPAAGGVTAAGLQRRERRTSAPPPSRRRPGHASRPADAGRAAAEVQDMLSRFQAGVDEAERSAEPRPGQRRDGAGRGEA